MTRTPKPVSSFGPELFQALVEGSKKRIEIDLPYREAVAHRMRINQLREAMRKANHVQYPIVSATSVRIIWGEDAGFLSTPETRSRTNVRIPINKTTPAKLVIAPADDNFVKALQKAGINLPPLAPDSVVNTEPTVAPPEWTEDDFLTNLMKEPDDAANK